MSGPGPPVESSCTIPIITHNPKGVPMLIFKLYDIIQKSRNFKFVSYFYRARLVVNLGVYLCNVCIKQQYYNEQTEYYNT